MTTFYLKSEYRKYNFDLDTASQYSVTIPFSLCQEFFYPISNILSLNNKNIDYIAYFIGVDFSFNLNSEQIKEFIGNIELIQDNINDKIDALNISGLYLSDLDIASLSASNWKYMTQYKNNNKIIDWQNLLYSICTDLILISQTALDYNENLSGITM